MDRTIVKVKIENGVPAVILYNGKQYPVDRIASQKREVIHKLGGIGICYHVVIKGQIRFLYHRSKPDVWVVVKPSAAQKAAVGAIHCCADFRGRRD